MKKNWSKSFLLAALVLGMAACKKEEVIQPQPVPAPSPERQLLSMKSSGTLEPVYYAYDGQGRLVESVNPFLDQKTVYGNGKVSVSLADANHFIYADVKNGVLDNKGRLLSYDWVFHTPNQPDAVAKYVLTYNAAGNIIKSVRTNVATGDVMTDDYVWSDGNLVSDTYSINGQMQNHQEYTYTDLPNKVSVNLQDGIMNFYTDGLTGQRSRNLKKTRQNFNSQNVKNVDLLFSYDMDPQGYPVKIYIKDVQTNFQGDWTLAYQ